MVKISARSGQIKGRLTGSQCNLAPCRKNWFWEKHEILFNYDTFEIQKLKVDFLAFSWLVFDGEYEDHIARDMACTRVTSIVPQFYWRIGHCCGSMCYQFEWRSSSFSFSHLNRTKEKQCQQKQYASQRQRTGRKKKATNGFIQTIATKVQKL